MRLVLESTNELVDVDGVKCRKWLGTTAAGVECFVYVHRLAVAPGADAAQFEAELQRMNAPKKTDEELGIPSPPISLRHII